MTARKQRHRTPGFNMPTPLNPVTGQYAGLQNQGAFPFCGLFQVAATDDKTNYVICRGYDPRVNKFWDYEAGNSDKPGIPVAKPYGRRATEIYEIGEIHIAFLPIMRIGQNPGVAADSDGHPVGLNEEVEILKDENDVVINWMLISDKGTQESSGVLHQFCRFTASTNFTDASPNVSGTIEAQWGGEQDHESTTATFNNLKTHTAGTYVFEGDSGDYGLAIYTGTGIVWDIWQFECQ